VLRAAPSVRPATPHPARSTWPKARLARAAWAIEAGPSLARARRMRSSILAASGLAALALAGCVSSVDGLPPPTGMDGASGLADGGGGPDGAAPDGAAPLPDAAVFDAAVSDAAPGGDLSVPGNDGMRIIPPEVLARKALSYSGYRAGQSPDTQVYPTEAQIKEDLQILIRGGWTFLRLFDCSPNTTRILKVIKDNQFDIKVMVGVSIAGSKAQHDQENRAEIERCIPIFTNHADIVVAVSIGNETLDEWSNVLTPAADLTAYIKEVRSRISQPVTTDDMYLPFTFGSDGTTSYADVVQVAQAVDFLAIHCYPFLDAPYDAWDWKQQAVPAGHQRAVAMMKAAFQYTKSSIDSVRTAMAGKGLDLPILLGETGWKSATGNGTNQDATEKFRAHPVNQKMYYDAIMDWVYGSGQSAASPKAAFYFEGFDEPWKTDDDNWGLLDVDRNAKYVIWTILPDLKPANAPAYTDNDAVYYH
jgi:exo-beta-1,3-glucanase (GH17 family)